MDTMDKSCVDLIQTCLRLILKAMRNVDEQFKQVTVATQEDEERKIIKRERVYAYELYHQMRCLQERCSKLKQYSINAEIDKAAHPIIQTPFNPDMVIHHQGTMNNNLCAIEIKTDPTALSGIKKDFCTLSCMVHRYQYQCGVFIILNQTLEAFCHERQAMIREICELKHCSDKIYIIAEREKDRKLCCMTVTELQSRESSSAYE